MTAGKLTKTSIGGHRVVNARGRACVDIVRVFEYLKDDIKKGRHQKQYTYSLSSTNHEESSRRETPAYKSLPALPATPPHDEPDSQ